LTAGDLDAAKMRALYVDLEAGAIATPYLVGNDEGAQLRARALRHEIVAWGVILASERIDASAAEAEGRRDDIGG